MDIQAQAEVERDRLARRIAYPRAPVLEVGPGPCACLTLALARRGLRVIAGHPPDAGLLVRLHTLLKAYFARVNRVAGLYAVLFICHGPASFVRRLCRARVAVSGSP
jgi:hypothetical protein